MTLFVLCINYPYEGYDVIGIYSSLAKAEEAREVYVTKHKLYGKEELFIFQQELDEEAE